MAQATGIGQLFMLATFPLLTRAYDPISFGLFALVTAFVGIVSVGVCLCLDLAIVQGRTADAADELCAAALYSVPITTTLSAIGLTVLTHFNLLGYGKLPLWCIPISAAMIGLNGVYVACRYRMLREQRFRIVARVTLLQSGGRAVAPLAWSLVAPGWLGLSLGELTGRLLGVGGLLVSLLPQLTQNSAWASGRRWWIIVLREKQYTAALLSSVLVDSVASQSIAPLLAAAYGAKAAGEYFLVATLLMAPAVLLGTAAADVIHPRAARLLIDAPEQLPKFLNKASALLLLAGLGIYVPTYFLAPILLPIIFDKHWTLIVQITQAMTPFAVVAFVASPCSRMLIALRQTRWKITSDMVRLFGTPITVCLAVMWGKPFADGIWMLTWFLTGAYCFYFAVTYHATRRISQIPPKNSNA